jgi:hypothetical protein
MAEAERYLGFEKLFKVVPTSGSAPLLCLLSDGKEYFCKRSNFLHSCRYDLVNEVLAVEVLKNWGVFTAEYQLTRVNYTQVKEPITLAYQSFNKLESLIKVQNPFSEDVFSIPLFACKNFSNASYLVSPEMDLGIFSEYKIKNTQDVFLITLFDLWFHNIDRKASNTNTLIVADENGRKMIVPIDHVQCFGVNRKFNLDKLDTALPILGEENTLMGLPFIKEFSNSLTENEKKIIIGKSTHLLQNALVVIQSVSNLFPKEWQATEYLQAISIFLGDKGRNEKIINKYTKMLLT